MPQPPSRPEPVISYSVPGIRPGDPEILVIFRRPPSAVALDLARFLQQQTQPAAVAL